MTTIHGLSREESRTWDKVVRGLVKLYRKVAGVARTHGPHAQADGAALATLYRLELAAIASDSERACDKTLAMEEVNEKIGQPPHKADTRFQVESFFLSVELRYTLAEIALSRIEGLNTTSRERGRYHHAHAFVAILRIIYLRILRPRRREGPHRCSEIYSFATLPELEYTPSGEARAFPLRNLERTLINGSRWGLGWCPKKDAKQQGQSRERKLLSPS
jgi:hypothetical protein